MKETKIETPEIEAARVVANILKKPVDSRKFYDVALLEDMLTKIKCFRDKNIKFWEISAISKHLFLVKAKHGDLVFDYKTHSKGFYTILIGKVKVEVPCVENRVNGGQIISWILVAELEMGESFGELASLIGRRSARITALSDCRFAVLPMEPFEKLLKRHKVKRIKKVVKFLLETPYFLECRPYNIMLIQFYFDMRKYIKGQNVCNTGESLSYIYFVKSGEFEIKMSIPKDSQREIRMKRRLGDDGKQMAKRGAHGLGQLLRREDKYCYTPTGQMDSTVPKDNIAEISIKKIGQGEMFGQIDLFNSRDQYSATLKCISLVAEIYFISVENFNRWVRNLEGVSNYIDNEVKSYEETTNELIEQHKRIKANKTIIRITNKFLTTSPNKHYKENSPARISPENNTKSITEALDHTIIQNKDFKLPINLRTRNITEDEYPKKCLTERKKIQTPMENSIKISQEAEFYAVNQSRNHRSVKNPSYNIKNTIHKFPYNPKFPLIIDNKLRNKEKNPCANQIEVINYNENMKEKLLNGITFNEKKGLDSKLAGNKNTKQMAPLNIVAINCTPKNSHQVIEKSKVSQEYQLEPDNLRNYIIDEEEQITPLLKMKAKSVNKKETNLSMFSNKLNRHTHLRNVSKAGISSLINLRSNISMFEDKVNKKNKIGYMRERNASLPQKSHRISTNKEKLITTINELQLADKKSMFNRSDLDIYIPKNALKSSTNNSVSASNYMTIKINRDKIIMGGGFSHNSGLSSTKTQKLVKDRDLMQRKEEKLERYYDLEERPEFRKRIGLGPLHSHEKHDLGNASTIINIAEE